MVYSSNPKYKKMQAVFQQFGKTSKNEWTQHVFKTQI